mgnify:CR=1 FL=1
MRDGSEGRTHHVDHLRINVLGDDTALGCDVLEHLMKRLSLDLLSLELRARIVKVKKNSTLGQLFDEELGTITGWGFWMMVKARIEE